MVVQFLGFRLYATQQVPVVHHQALVFTLLYYISPSVLLWSSPRTVGFTRETAKLLLRKDLAHVKVYVVTQQMLGGGN